MKILAVMPLTMVISKFFSGQEAMNVRETNGLAFMLLEVVIWKFYSGREAMAVPGTRGRAAKQLGRVI